MSIPKIVPWFDWLEWRYVMTSYFASNQVNESDEIFYHHDNDENISFAFDLVSLWKKRGRCNIAIDSTTQLINNIRYLYQKNNNLSASDEESMRSIYSLTLIRTINGLVDQCQNQYYANSMYNIAKEINIPGWIIELRHEATHNELPSLTVLKTATLNMIFWFRDHYWKHQLYHINSLKQEIFVNPSSSSSTYLQSSSSTDTKSRKRKREFDNTVDHNRYVNSRLIINIDDGISNQTKKSKSWKVTNGIIWPIGFSFYKYESPQLLNLTCVP